MRNINLFAVSLSQEKIPIGENIKKEMINEIQSMVSDSKNKDYKISRDSWTGDTQGFEYLYKNKKFNILFQEIKKQLIDYIKKLGINENEIDLYMTRSWATVSRGKERISSHKHRQSHISFAYYLKKNKDDANIVFYDEHFQNEFVPGLFTSSTLRNKGVIKELNIFNASNIDIPVEENDIIIFPSKTLHGTQSNKTNDERISISGDVVCVSKNSELLETIMPPINNWDKM